MTEQRLMKLNPHDFDKMFYIMQISFPDDEHRSYKEQKELLLIPEYQIYVMKSSSTNEIISFIAIWNFDQIAYIEHFAVRPEFRNLKIGSKMLAQLIKFLGKRICLEVEPPENNIAIHRIKFYERHNFYLNKYPYIQPAISKGKKEIPLMIMTYNESLDKRDFDIIKNLLYSKVYKTQINK